MRTTVRWLTSLAPATLLLLLVLHYYELPVGVVRHLSDSPLFDAIGISRPKSTGSTRLSDLDEVPTSIPILWQQWSSVMFDTRPRSPQISLDSSAQTVRPDNNHEIRVPSQDLVRNTPADLESLRKSHALFVEELGKIGTEHDIFSGRGVVMVGGGEYYGPAIISIHMLRRTGCTLPAEVFVPNKDEYEPEVCEQYLSRLNARCVVLTEIMAHAKGLSAKLNISHYQLKSLALLLSSFAEVLLLDSDSMSMVDPEKDLFAVEPYTTNGLVIWPDFWSSTESPRFWTIAGLAQFPTGLPATSSEAGQLLINKKTHLKTLLLATYYNVFGPEYYYPLLSQGALGQGDKETFMAAAVVLNATYHRVQTPVTTLGRHDGHQQRGTAMVQHLPSDDLEKSQSTNDNAQVKPAFVHANTPKMNAGHLVDEGDLFTHNGRQRLRLLGSQAEQVTLFGYDLEKTIWELLVQTGCELAAIVRDWKGRDRLCERLEEHFAAVFAADTVNRRFGIRTGI